MKQLRAAWVAGCMAIGAISLSACGVPLSERVIEITNRCSADSDCGGEGRCIENTCVATTADLGELVLEIEVPAGSAYAPSTTQVVSPRYDDIVLSGSSAGFYQIYTIYLPELVEVTIELEIDNLPAECGGLSDANGLVPIRVELSQTRGAFGEIPPGVATRVYDATTTNPEDATKKSVTINVPAGAYDLYITPLVPGDPLDQEGPYPGCILPPRLISDRDISDGLVRDTVTYNAIDPGHAGTVEGFDLDGWTVALIENKKGRLVSDVFPLTLSVANTPVPFLLRYWFENGEDGIVLRLTPPPDLAATGGMPVFYWLLANLPTKAVTIETLRDAEPIEVGGGILDENLNFTVPATITIHSDDLDIGFGPNVSYRRTIQTDPDGGFGGFKLLPGNYTFIIQPAAGDDLAVTSRPFSLAKGSPGTGQGLTVQRKLPLNGTSVTAQGAPAARINALLEAATPESGTYLQNIQRPFPVLPDSVATVTSESGDFSLLVDRGTFNFSLRPEPSSDLPWAVVSRYFIDPGQESLQPLVLTIPNPVLLVGEIRSLSPAGTIANARIRAWLRPTQLDPEADNVEPAALQIAETTSQENGSFRLVLPGSLATISQ